ncbi:hypothetical protein [Streptomyces sp. NPDC047014]
MHQYREPVDTQDAPVGVEIWGEPDSDLLDRALVGWERFLRTLRATPDD